MFQGWNKLEHILLLRVRLKIFRIPGSSQKSVISHFGPPVEENRFVCQAYVLQVRKF